ncbi:hypothetical protein C8Q80DRAFT_1149844 [Daedaleopsis nitida]|nr:hypothetical protein C8Q80DRAFT_1149844 [Daedaleopsis nitida]
MSYLGEPSFQGVVVSNAKDEEARRTQRHSGRRHSSTTDLRTGSAAPTSSPIKHRPQIVPRMHDVPESSLSRVPTPPGYLQPNQDASPVAPGAKTSTHPPLHALEKMLEELEEQTLDYPDLRREVEQLQRVIYVIRNKEVWMDDRIKKVQQLRLSVEEHYLAEVKRQPWLLGDDRTESRREDELFGMPVARDEVVHSSNEEAVNAPTWPSQSRSKRKTGEVENVRTDPPKRIRVST